MAPGPMHSRFRPLSRLLHRLSRLLHRLFPLFQNRRRFLSTAMPHPWPAPNSLVLLFPRKARRKRRSILAKWPLQPTPPQKRKISTTKEIFRWRRWKHRSSRRCSKRSTRSRIFTSDLAVCRTPRSRRRSRPMSCRADRSGDTKSFAPRPSIWSRA